LVTVLDCTVAIYLEHPISFFLVADVQFLFTAAFGMGMVAKSASPPKADSIFGFQN
jgi:hypothetical protein